MVESKLTKNDRRVLEAVEYASGEWDGFAPHGARDWCAIRRLHREALVDCIADYGVCQVCPDSHEVPVYVLTANGKLVLGCVQTEVPRD